MAAPDDPTVGYTYGEYCGATTVQSSEFHPETPYQCQQCGRWGDSEVCHKCACPACVEARARWDRDIAEARDRAIEKLIEYQPEYQHAALIEALIFLGPRLFHRLFCGMLDAKDWDLVKVWLNERKEPYYGEIEDE